MKKLLLLTSVFAIAISCHTAYTPNYDFGNYTYETTGVRNEDNGTILVKTMTTGTNYKEAIINAQKKALKDIMLKGIEKGCTQCIKPALFQNRQNDESTKEFITQFLSNEKNIETYTIINRELATWEQKRDMKFTQNQPLGFEIIVKYDELKKIITNTTTNENK